MSSSSALEPLPVACFVTSHGFGHGTRTAAVLQALARQAPGLKLDLFSTLPEWFWEENLSSLASFRSHQVRTDVGLVQKSAFEHDLDQTLSELGAFLSFGSEEVERVRKTLLETGPAVILCDVSPLGLFLGKELGIPTVLLENFTWDWIYGGYLEADSRFGPYIEQLGEIFRSADLRIQTEPLCERMQEHPIVPPIFREFEQSPERTLERLALPAGSRYLLVTTGGIPHEYSFLERLKGRQDVHFLVTGSFSQLQREENLTLLPHRCGFHFPDLVRASCGVAGKVGYGTVAETWGARVPLLAVYRDNFRESSALRSFVEGNLPNMEASQSDFLNGSWIGRIDDFLALSTIEKSGRGSGAREVAKLTLSIA